MFSNTYSSWFKKYVASQYIPMCNCMTEEKLKCDSFFPIKLVSGSINLKIKTVAKIDQSNMPNVI